jgi:DNA-binding winged helix-turn-helix (wHTH) protein
VLCVHSSAEVTALSLENERLRQEINRLRSILSAIGRKAQRAAEK